MSLKEALEKMSLAEKNELFHKTYSAYTKETILQMCATIALIRHGVTATTNHCIEVYNNLLLTIKPDASEHEPDFCPSIPQLQSILRTASEWMIQALDGEVV